MANCSCQYTSESLYGLSLFTLYIATNKIGLLLYAAFLHVLSDHSSPQLSVSCVNFSPYAKQPLRSVIDSHKITSWVTHCLPLSILPYGCFARVKFAKHTLLIRSSRNFSWFSVWNKCSFCYSFLWDFLVYYSIRPMKFQRPSVDLHFRCLQFLHIPSGN